MPEANAADLHDLAAERWAEELGVLTPAAVARRAAEVSRAVRSGRWQRLGRCVVTHNGPVTDDQRMWAAVLSPPSTAALAREAALAASGMTGLRGARLTVAHEWGTSCPPIEGVTYVRTRHLTQDLVASQPRRMTAARAVVDAASRAAPDRARTLLAMVVQQRKATPRAIRQVLERVRPVRQEVLIRLTLADVEGGAESLPELRFTRLMVAARLPLPTRQVVRMRRDGRFYLDVEWEEYGLVGEIDGTHHRDAAQWEADVLRQDELMIGGDRVLRLLSWWVRDRPELTVDLVRRALIACGWRP